MPVLREWELAAITVLADMFKNPTT